MNRIKTIGWIVAGFLLLLQTGCEGVAPPVTQTAEEQLTGTQDITTASVTEEPPQVSTQQEAETKVKELEEKDNLDTWLGTYTFDEVSGGENDEPFMFMDYDVNIYKEDGRYYADVVINGQFTGVNVKTNVYGSTEWVSFVLKEYNPDHVVGLSNCENDVLFSMRKCENNIYTYWGIQEPLLPQNRPSGCIYFEQTESNNTESMENSAEGNDLNAWIGTYSFTEESETDGVLQKTQYLLNIYNEDGQYYGDMITNGLDTDMEVKLKIYGDEQWISLVLSEIKSEETEKLEDMKEMVLFSLGKQDEQVYIYWGGEDMTRLLKKDYLTYYRSNCYFEAVTE